MTTTSSRSATSHGSAASSSPSPYRQSKSSGSTRIPHPNTQNRVHRGPEEASHRPMLPSRDHESQDILKGRYTEREHLMARELNSKRTTAFRALLLSELTRDVVYVTTCGNTVERFSEHQAVLNGEKYIDLTPASLYSSPPPPPSETPLNTSKISKELPAAPFHEPLPVDRNRSSPDDCNYNHSNHGEAVPVPPGYDDAFLELERQTTSPTDDPHAKEELLRGLAEDDSRWTDSRAVTQQVPTDGPSSPSSLPLSPSPPPSSSPPLSRRQERLTNNFDLLNSITLELTHHQHQHQHNIPDRSTLSSSRHPSEAHGPDHTYHRSYPRLPSKHSHPSSSSPSASISTAFTSPHHINYRQGTMPPMRSASWAQLRQRFERLRKEGGNPPSRGGGGGGRQREQQRRRRRRRRPSLYAWGHGDESGGNNNDQDKDDIICDATVISEEEEEEEEEPSHGKDPLSVTPLSLPPPLPPSTTAPEHDRAGLVFAELLEHALQVCDAGLWLRVPLPTPTTTVPGYGGRISLYTSRHAREPLLRNAEASLLMYRPGSNPHPDQVADIWLTVPGTVLWDLQRTIAEEAPWVTIDGAAGRRMEASLCRVIDGVCVPALPPSPTTSNRVPSRTCCSIL